MFQGLKLYTVHIKPGSDVTLAKPLFLREGFNWMGFLFTFLWAFSQRLWLFGLVVITASLLMMLAAHYGLLTEFSLSVVLFALYASHDYVGFHGNDVLRKSLMRRGYIFQDITSGDSLLRAEQRYFDRLVQAA